MGPSRRKTKTASTRRGPSKPARAAITSSRRTRDEYGPRPGRAGRARGGATVAVRPPGRARGAGRVVALANLDWGWPVRYRVTILWDQVREERHSFDRLDDALSKAEAAMLLDAMRVTIEPIEWP